jgi:hypothetical protein
LIDTFVDERQRQEIENNVKWRGEPRGHTIRQEVLAKTPASRFSFRPMSQSPHSMSKTMGIVR